MTSEIEYDSVEKLGGKRKETIPALPPYQLGEKKELSLSNEFVVSYVSAVHYVGESSCQNEALLGRKRQRLNYFALWRLTKNISKEKKKFWHDSVR